MKKIHLYIGYALLAASLYSCDDFLDRDPQNKLTNDTYWQNETSLRTYAQGFYSTYFTGYGADYNVFGGYFSGDNFTDDFLTLGGGVRSFALSPTAGINATTAPWSTGYTIVYKANVMLEKIPGMNITDEAKAHWEGVARYFRAMAYSSMAKIYGAVPYFDRVTDPADAPTLYKDRDPYLFVAQKILEDYQFALNNVRFDDTKLQVNKYVVGAYMSRDMLYHATWLKYHGTTIGTASQAIPEADLKPLFQGAINGAEVVMAGPFAIGNDYNAIFTSEDLSTNKEVIFYREYVTGLKNGCNALMSYNAAENMNETGSVTENVIESYLCSDGLPIGQSPLYKGKSDPSIMNSFQNRDPRLYQTVVDSLRIYNGGLDARGASPTGYAPKKFLNEQWFADGLAYTQNINSPADAPTIRLAEVLLNYVEARYEISKIGGAAFAQTDLEKSINLLRGRKLVKWGETPQVVRDMPKVTLRGNSISVKDVVIDDPARDQEVDPVLWEIRRERRVELVMEGRRGEDLRRWAKYEYLNSEDGEGNPDKTFLGAYVKVADYPGLRIGNDGVTLFDPADPTNPAPAEGYIRFFTQTEIRVFNEGRLDSERNYLRAVSPTEITAYKDKGYTLTQNPGWE